MDLAARPRWPLDQNAAPMLGAEQKGPRHERFGDRRGAFGTALAVSLASKGRSRCGVAIPAGRERENPRLPGDALPAGLQVTARLDKIDSQTLLLALPAQVLGGF